LYYELVGAIKPLGVLEELFYYFWEDGLLMEFIFYPQVFFCKYNDPIYVKMEKLEIMIKLASDRNIDQVLLACIVSSYFPPHSKFISWLELISVVVSILYFCNQLSFHMDETHTMSH